MKLIISCLLVCLLLQTGFFVIRDAVSATVSIFDRSAEISLFLMFATMFLYSRHPRISMLASGLCAVVIVLNLESHSADHSVSAILARNLLMIIFFIIGTLGFPGGRPNASEV